MAAADQLTGLLSLVSALNGKTSTTTTSGGTTTQQTNVSDAGVQQLLNQILSGSGGVKDIGTRARASGLYNSTTEQSLLQNLYTDAATKAELARSPTTTTTSGTTSKTTTPGTSVSDLATGLGGAFLASQAINLGSQILGPSIKEGTSSLASSISDLLGLSGGTSDSGSGSGSSFFGLDNILTGTSGGFGTTIGTGTGISTGEGYGLNTGSSGILDTSGGNTGATGLNFGFNTDTGTSSVGISGLGALGGIASSVLGGLVGNSNNGSAGAGSNGTSGGSIICTALMSRGLLNEEHYKAGDAYIQRVHPLTKLGYYWWAQDIAEKIKKGSKFWTKVCLPFAAGRTALLASSGSFWDHLRHPLGSLTKFVGEPICHLLGHILADKILDMYLEDQNAKV